MVGKIRLRQLGLELENKPTLLYELVRSSDEYHININYYAVIAGKLCWIDTKTFPTNELTDILAELHYNPQFEHLSNKNNYQIVEGYEYLLDNNVYDNTNRVKTR